MSPCSSSHFEINVAEMGDVSMLSENIKKNLSKKTFDISVILLISGRFLDVDIPTGNDCEFQSTEVAIILLQLKIS